MTLKSTFAATALSAVTLATAVGCSANNSNQKEANAATPAVTEKSTDNQKVGYSLGYMMAEGNKQTIDDLDLDTFEKGFRDGYKGEDSALTQKQMQSVLMAYQKKKEAEFNNKLKDMSAENKAAGDKFLKENAKKPGVQTTQSGLEYKVLKKGTGPSPKPSDTVKVNYEGKLLDGTVFDSSYKRGEPVSFPVNQVIPGWTEGLQLMHEGAKYQFFIPADLAYGEAGNQGIEPNSTLIFTVELLKVNPKT